MTVSFGPGYGLSFGPRADITSPIGLADGWTDVCVYVFHWCYVTLVQTSFVIGRPVMSACPGVCAVLLDAAPR